MKVLAPEQFTPAQIQQAAEQYVTAAIEFYPLRQPVHELLLKLTGYWVAQAEGYVALINIKDGSVLEKFGTTAAAFETLIKMGMEKLDA